MIITIMKCDRCKKEIKPSKIGLIMELISPSWSTGISIKLYDEIQLCEECIRKFRIFIKEGIRDKYKWHKNINYLKSRLDVSIAGL